MCLRVSVAVIKTVSKSSLGRKEFRSVIGKSGQEPRGRY